MKQYPKKVSNAIQEIASCLAMTVLIKTALTMMFLIKAAPAMTVLKKLHLQIQF
jgi:hypothetical protein